MADTLAGHEAERLRYTLMNVEAETLADTLGEGEAERLSHTRGDVEIKVLIDTMVDTLLERKAKTVIKTIRGVEGIQLLYTSSDTVCKTEAEKLRHTLADTLPEANT